MNRVSHASRCGQGVSRTDRLGRGQLSALIFCGWTRLNKQNGRPCESAQRAFYKPLCAYRLLGRVARIGNNVARACDKSAPRAIVCRACTSNVLCVRLRLPTRWHDQKAVAGHLNMRGAEYLARVGIQRHLRAIRA